MTAQIGITGVAGRMGRALAEFILGENSDCKLVAAVERPESSLIGVDVGEFLGGEPIKVAVTADLEAVISQADVLIDFTVPQATVKYASICANMGIPMVVGTTGFSNGQQAHLARIANIIAICQASNFSMGVNLGFQLVETAARAIGESVDIEIIEAHHRDKVDSPSGTALSLGRIVSSALGSDFDKVAVFGRQGQTGSRSRSTIGFSTVRAGDIVGEHTVIFAGEGERLEITHKASSRMAFASGAVLAACWVAGKPAGHYDMRDVLGS